MKKVLILANKVPYPSKDGSSIAMARMLESLLSIEDIDITYGALNTIKHKKDVADFPQDILDKVIFTSFEVDTSPNIISGIQNLLFTNKPYNAIRFFVNSMRKWLLTFDDYYFDHVIIEGAFMGDYLPIAKKKGKHVILRSHNLEHVIWERIADNVGDPFRKFYLNLQASRLKSFEEHLTKQSDSIWSISPVDAAWFKGWNIHTHHIPVAVEDGVPVQAIVPMRCFHLGALDWEPNLQGIEWFLSLVWPLVLDMRPEAEFHMAGNNTPEHIKSQPENKVTVHGRVSNAESFSKSHGISIIPLLSGSGIRIKLLENARIAIPVISTTVGAEGVYNRSRSMIPLADEPLDFAEKLVDLLDHPEKAKQMGLCLQNDIMTTYSMPSTIKLIDSAWPL